MTYPVFRVHRARVRDDLSLAYWHEGRGGRPLLLVHGFPETKRIWARNVEALVAAGFEVVVPDLRGFGDSDTAADGFYDPAAYARDLHALVHDVLGHERCSAAAGDVGGVVLPDLAARFPGFVERLCIFNTALPLLDDAYAKAGIPPDPPREESPQADYYVRQGTDGDGLLAECDTPERRRAWVAAMYTHRLWASRGSFTPDDVAYMTEPFADAAKFRASYGVYEVAYGKRAISETPFLFEPCRVPTLVLYGPDDAVVPPSFLARAEIAFPECIGPLVVPGAGHFLQWERAELLNRALAAFL